MSISIIGLVIIASAFVYRSKEKLQKDIIHDSHILNAPSASPAHQSETDYAIDMDDIEFL